MTDPESKPPRKLYRSEDDRLIAGLCAGVGEYLGLDPTVVRFLWVAGTLLSGGAGIPLYVVLWIVVPTRSRVDAPPREVARDNLNEASQRAREGVDQARETYRRWRGHGSGEAPAPPTPIEGSDPESGPLPGPEGPPDTGAPGDPGDWPRG